MVSSLLKSGDRQDISHTYDMDHLASGTTIEATKKARGSLC